MNTAATDKQMAFLTKLAAERDYDIEGRTFTKTTASAMIDKLLSMPVKMTRGDAKLILGRAAAAQARMDRPKTPAQQRKIDAQAAENAAKIARYHARKAAREAAEAN